MLSNVTKSIKVKSGDNNNEQEAQEQAFKAGCSKMVNTLHPSSATWTFLLQRNRVICVFLTNQNLPAQKKTSTKITYLKPALKKLSFYCIATLIVLFPRYKLREFKSVINNSAKSIILSLYR